MEQLRARRPRHHLLRAVALVLSYNPLLRQLLVHLLPASAAAGHDLLLHQDPVGSESCGQAGELAAHVTFQRDLPASTLLSVHVCRSV